MAYIRQVRAAVRSTAVRDDHTQRDVHEDRQQQVHNSTACLHVGSRPHQLSADARTQRETFPGTDRQR